MALDTAGLKSEIQSLLSDMESKNEDAKEEFATRLANAITAFVMTGQVNTVVTTAGTATAQSGTGVGNIT